MEASVAGDISNFFAFFVATVLFLIYCFPKELVNALFSVFSCFFVFRDIVQATTPLEQCEWLNKLLIEVWPNYISPRLSLRFSSIVEVNYFVLYLSVCAGPCILLNKQHNLM